MGAPRTFVRVDIEPAEQRRAFAQAMTKRGLVRTGTGKPSGQKLRLPQDMYLIERADAIEALELTQQAAKNTNVRARIFCVPVGGHIRFCNLQPSRKR